MQTLEVSLSRAHKIVERLNESFKNALTEAEELSSLVSITAYPSPSGIEELRNRSDRAYKAIENAQKYSEALASVRTVIAIENNKRGIDRMLARLDALNKISATLKQIVATSKKDGYLPVEVELYPKDSSSYFNLVVNPIRGTASAKLVVARYAEVQRDLVQLSDAISEANAPRVKLELPDNIVALVTGAA